MSSNFNKCNQQTVKEVTNIATVKYGNFSKSAEATFYIKSNDIADLMVCQHTDKDYTHVNCKLYFVIKVRNLGPDNATNVLLINDLTPKENIRLISIFVSHGTYCYNDGKLIWNLGEVCKDGSATAIIKVIPTKPGAYRSCAFVYGTEYDPNMFNNHTAAKTIVSPRHCEC